MAGQSCRTGDSQQVLLINTLLQLQRGVVRRPEAQNRFNGFCAVLKTVEPVEPLRFATLLNPR
jgi:hypothetical protein